MFLEYVGIFLLISFIDSRKGGERVSAPTLNNYSIDSGGGGGLKRTKNQQNQKKKMKEKTSGSAFFHF